MTKAIKKLTQQNFIEMLRNLRTSAGLSQGDVRKALGYSSAQFVSNWERGISEPPVETIKVLAVLYKAEYQPLLESYIRYRQNLLNVVLRKKAAKSKFPDVLPPKKSI